MGTKFSITGDAVNRHAGNLDGSVADLNANLQQFINALAGLPGVWRGAAFQSFDQLQQRWEQASQELNLAHCIPTPLLLGDDDINLDRAVGTDR